MAVRDDPGKEIDRPFAASDDPSKEIDRPFAAGDDPDERIVDPFAVVGDLLAGSVAAVAQSDDLGAPRDRSGGAIATPAAATEAGSAASVAHCSPFLTAGSGGGTNTAALTRSRALFYKLPLSLGLVLGLLAGRPALAEKTVHGAVVPGGSREVGQDRYRSPEGYEETLKFYWKTYSSEHYPRKHIADLPGVRAVHIVNPGRGGWDGLNIYELNGETRIFVVARAQPPRPSKKHR